MLAKCFATNDVAWVEEKEGDLLNHLPSWLKNKSSRWPEDPSVTFKFQGGTAATRFAAWQAVLIFCNHTKSTPMPAGTMYPGLTDPGVGVALPLTYNTFEGLIHLAACLTMHASGETARGSAITLEITVAGQSTFSIQF